MYWHFHSIMSKKEKSVPGVKILIDLDEYLRLMKLKETIKKQEEELNKHYQTKIPQVVQVDKSPNVSESTVSEDKSGGGQLQHHELLTHLKNQIDNLESQIKSKSLNQTGSGANDLIAQIPTPIDPEIDEQQRIEQFRPVSSATIQKSRLNDDFDNERLLSNIPSALLPRAKKLIDDLNSRANEVTWDTAGVVFIDQQSLPDSDIYFLFPRLFRKVSNPDKIVHLQELATKIATMGLGYLINRRLTAGLNRTKPLPNHDELQEKIANSVNWWYIGEK